MNKKAQSISINTIIIAVIGLAVLVVLFYIFSARLGIFTGGISDTASCENTCKGLNMQKGEAPTKELCASTGTHVAGTYKDVSQGNVCCCTPTP